MLYGDLYDNDNHDMRESDVLVKRKKGRERGEEERKDVSCYLLSCMCIMLIVQLV